VRPIGLAGGHAPNEIPESHRDLVECPPVAALSTVAPDGYPQTSVVWCDFDGACVRVNTMRGFAKERNMRRNPRVTLLCYDPRRPLRYLEVRGTVVAMTEEGAGRHLDELASKYAGRPIRYFGDAIPAHFAETEIAVLCSIRPTHVVALDASDPTGHLTWTGEPFASLSFIDPAFFRPLFAADLSPKKAQALNDGQQASSVALLVSPSGPVGWHAIPSWYAISALDFVIDPALQRFMADRAGATTIQFDDASHAGGYTHYAARFTKLIEQAVSATSG